MGKLQDRIAIVTGGGSGIGRACAELFAAEGAKLVIADIDEQVGRTAAKDVGGLYLQVDVTDPSSVEAMIETSVEKLGRIDILMNNAGIDGDHALTGDSSIENWKRVRSIL